MNVYNEIKYSQAYVLGNCISTFMTVELLKSKLMYNKMTFIYIVGKCLKQILIHQPFIE